MKPYQKNSFSECCKNNQYILTESSISERVAREYGFTPDENISMARLVESEKGRAALKAMWNEYAEIAFEYDLPFIALTSTRRLNKERCALAGCDASLIRKNVEFLREIQSEQRAEMYVGGLLGCRGDAYTGKGNLDHDSAVEFHSWEVERFKEAGVDFFYASLQPTFSEANGIANVLSDSEIPYLISFTIERSGCMIDGTPICEAIEKIDSMVKNRPLFYMTNCVHPTIVYDALSKPFNQKDIVKKRFLGIQANPSPLPYEELDNAVDLKTSPPDIFAEEMVRLNNLHPFKLFGGCCGTDGSHMSAIADRLTKNSSDHYTPMTH